MSTVQNLVDILWDSNGAVNEVLCVLVEANDVADIDLEPPTEQEWDALVPILDHSAEVGELRAALEAIARTELRRMRSA